MGTNWLMNQNLWWTKSGCDLWKASLCKFQMNHLQTDLPVHASTLALCYCYMRKVGSLKNFSSLPPLHWAVLGGDPGSSLENCPSFPDECCSCGSPQGEGSNSLKSSPSLSNGCCLCGAPWRECGPTERGGSSLKSSTSLHERHWSHKSQEEWGSSLKSSRSLCQGNNAV